MFNKDCKLLPRTYSVKSYKRREASGIRKTFKFLMYVMIFAVILGFSFLSMKHYI